MAAGCGEGSRWGGGGLLCGMAADGGKCASTRAACLKLLGAHARQLLHLLSTKNNKINDSEVVERAVILILFTLISSDETDEKALPAYQLKHNTSKYLGRFLLLYPGLRSGQTWNNTSFQQRVWQWGQFSEVEPVVQDQEPQGSTTSIRKQEVRIATMFTVCLWPLTATWVAAMTADNYRDE